MITVDDFTAINHTLLSVQDGQDVLITSLYVENYLTLNYGSMVCIADTAEKARRAWETYLYFNKENLKRMIAAWDADYEPLDNVFESSRETITDTTSTTRSGSVERAEDGSEKTEYRGGDTTTYAGTETTTQSGNITDQQSGTMTQTQDGKEKTIQRGSETTSQSGTDSMSAGQQSHESADYKVAFDSSVEKETGRTSSTDQPHTDTTTYGKAETLAFNGRETERQLDNMRTVTDYDDYAKTTTYNDLTSVTSYDGRTDTRQFTNRSDVHSFDGRKNTETYQNLCDQKGGTIITEKERHGNIGVTSSQQMITQELDMRLTREPREQWLDAFVHRYFYDDGRGEDVCW